MSVKTSIAPRRLTQGFFAFLLLSERLNVITAHLSCFRQVKCYNQITGKKKNPQCLQHQGFRRFGSHL